LILMRACALSCDHGGLVILERVQKVRADPEIGLCPVVPRQDSNLRSRLRRAISAILKIVGKCLQAPDLLVYMRLLPLINIGCFQFWRVPDVYPRRSTHSRSLFESLVRP